MIVITEANYRPTRDMNAPEWRSQDFARANIRGKTASVLFVSVR